MMIFFNLVVFWVFFFVCLCVCCLFVFLGDENILCLVVCLQSEFISWLVNSQTAGLREMAVGFLEGLTLCHCIHHILLFMLFSSTFLMAFLPLV